MGSQAQTAGEVVQAKEERPGKHPGIRIWCPVGLSSERDRRQRPSSAVASAKASLRATKASASMSSLITRGGEIFTVPPP